MSPAVGLWATRAGDTGQPPAEAPGSVERQAAEEGATGRCWVLWVQASWGKEGSARLQAAASKKTLRSGRPAPETGRRVVAKACRPAGAEGSRRLRAAAAAAEVAAAARREAGRALPRRGPGRGSLEGAARRAALAAAWQPGRKATECHCPEQAAALHPRPTRAVAEQTRLAVRPAGRGTQEARFVAPLARAKARLHLPAAAAAEHLGSLAPGTRRRAARCWSGCRCWL